MGKRSGKVGARAGVAASAAGLDGAAARARRTTASSGLRRGPLALLLACGLGVACPVYAQTAIFQETFTGGRVTSSGTPVTPTSDPASITNFTGAAPTNMTYTANIPAWSGTINNCNGRVSSWSMSDAPGSVGVTACGTRLVWNQVQGLALALGAYGANLPGNQDATNAGPAATENLALTAFTGGDPGQPNTVIQNAQTIALPALPPGGTSRFVTFSFIASAMNCQVNPPLVTFSLNGTQLGAGNSNLCTMGSDVRNYDIPPHGVVANTSSVRAARFFPGGAGARLVNGPMTFSVVNRQANGAGNDWAWDNFTAVDVSPTLSKAVDGIDYVTQTKRITFTITNTAGDNQLKNGWAFTETLPAGVTIAATPNIVVGGTAGCTATTNATAGGTTLTVTNGNLPAGTPSGNGGIATACTIAVDVVSNTAGVFNNVVNNGDGAVDNITTSTGLNLALQTVPMEWVVNRLTVTKISQDTTGTFSFSGNNGIANHTIVTTAAGAPGTAGAAQTLTIASLTANTTVTETALPAGWDVSGTPSCTGLAAGQSATYTAATRTLTLPFAGLSVTTGGRQIQCTFTNAPRAVNLTLRKQWAAAVVGDDATITASRGGTVIDTFDSDAGAANELDTDATPTVSFVGDNLTLAETLAAANGGAYDTVLACTGAADTNPADGLSVGVADTAIVCTYTNTHRSTDLSITKTNTPAAGPLDQAGDTVNAAQTTTYTLVATNNGTGPITGAVVRDAPTAGITCAPGNPVTITGNGVPPGSFTVADLTGAGGIVLATLAAGQSATLSFDCQVN